MKRALVLSGGSIKGAFQAGAIRHLLDSGWVPDILVGTSVGSLNASFLADRIGRQRAGGNAVDWPAAGAELEAFWRRNITGPDALIQRRSKAELAWDALSSKFDGFLRIDPLIALVKRELSLQNIRKSEVDLRIASVNVIDGRLKLADPEFHDLIDYVIASSAMPLIMPLSRIGGGRYTDGGIREVAPLDTAIDLGADQVFCIVCQAKELAAKHFEPGNLVQLSEQIMDVVTNETVTNDLRRTERVNAMIRKNPIQALSFMQKEVREVDIRIIRPADPIALGIEEFTPADIARMIDSGKYAAERPTPGSLA
jgi:NTE family protein